MPPRPPSARELPPPPRIGCHLSLGREPEAILRVAAEHGVECIQVFASSPGAWKPPLLDPGRSARIVAACAAGGIAPLFVHAIYLINLASEDAVLVRRSRISLVATLEAAARLGATGVITHIGSHGGRGFEAVAAQVAHELLQVLEHATSGLDLILENSAGAGALIGSTLDELAGLLHRAERHPRLKVALDTAHLCGAGWDFSQPEAAARLAERVHATTGFDRLVVLHANDSQAPPGSRRDRHAAIGRGHIGARGFRYLLHEAPFRQVPWICETPDLGADEPDEQFGSVTRLHRLARLRVRAVTPVPVETGRVS